MKKKTPVGFIVIIVLLACVMVYSGYRIYDIANTDIESSNEYNSLSSQYAEITDKPKVDENSTFGLIDWVKSRLIKKEADKTPEETEPIEEPEEGVPVLRKVEVDFDELKEINDSFIGWLYLPDTAINYPIAQHESNNTYYLNHLFTKEKNGTGAVFLDYRNKHDLSDDNSVIYAHHCQNGSMFNILIRLSDQTFYEEHPCFYLETEDKEYRLDVFACYVCGTLSAGYKKDIEDIDDWFEEIQTVNRITPLVTPKEGDKIFTFSTCAYEFDNARCVAHCIATETGGLTKAEYDNEMQKLQEKEELIENAYLWVNQLEETLENPLASPIL